MTAHRRTAALALSLACALSLGACKKKVMEQDKDEPAGDFQVRLIEAKFPKEQSLAKDSRMEITVENADTKRIPVINVTVKCETPVSGRTVVFAGALEKSSLEDTVKKIEAVGGNVANAVSRQTDYLVVGDDADESLVVAAQALNTPRIDEDELSKLLEQSGGLGGSFNTVVSDSDVADPERPQFIVNTIPTRAENPDEEEKGPPRPPLDPAPLERSTALVDTYSLGPLDPGDEVTFRWDVTAVRAGRYHLCWRVNAGLYGKAKAVAAEDSPPIAGSFNGEVSNEAPAARVADDGKTVIEDPPDADR
jgi:hypothetical protein